jgi:hypothetical protein
MLALLAALALVAPASRMGPGEPAADSIAHSPALDAFLPDTVIAPPGGVRIVVMGSPAPGVAALRLFVPLIESAPEAGIGFVLRDLALERMQSLARPVGARVEAARTPWGLAYGVEGSAADFDYLAYVLRQAVAAPDLGTPSFDGAIQHVRRRLDRDRETPAGRISVELRRAVAPGDPPLEGTAESLAGFDTTRVREVWARTHRSSRMTLVVSASVAPEAILAAAHDIGASPAATEPPPALAAAPPSSASISPPRPQTLRTWYALAFEGGSRADARAPIAALLVSDELHRSVEGFDARVELWDLRDRWILAVTGAAYNQDLTSMRHAVSDAVRNTAATLDSATVSTAVGRTYRDLLVQARTPLGLVSVVGHWLEGTNDPRAAWTFLDELRSVSAEAMARYFHGLLATTPAHAEVRP